MSELPSAEHYLPQWTTRRFIIVEESLRWSPAISAEVAQISAKSSLPPAVFEACLSARDAALYLNLLSTAGVVLFLEHLERECIGVVRRLSRLSRPLPTLIVANDSHRPLIPVLMESGGDSILLNVRDDRQIAAWCCRALAINPPR